jgi:hypothetical protein
MTDEELAAKVLEDEDLYDSLVSEYGKDYLYEEQPDDALMELDEENVKMACGDDAMNILQRAFFGYDFNPYNEDKKEPFNPNRDYFFLNGYANMVSVYDGYVDEYLKYAINKDEFVEWCILEGNVTESDVQSDEDEE